MPIAQMLFSFDGRMRRRDFWLVTIGLIVVSWVLTSIIGLVLVPPVMATPDYNGAYWMMWSRVSTSVWIVSLILLWPRLAVGVKRCHDRGKSGWWLLIGFVPVVGGLVLLYFMVQPSEPESNDYGAPPPTPAVAA